MMNDERANPQGRIVKFCFERAEMLKFIPAVFGLQGFSSPLAGIEGWNFTKFSFFHPPTLFALLFCY